MLAPRIARLATYPILPHLGDVPVNFRVLLSALLMAGPVVSVAQPIPPPRLIVAISVDQFSADLFSEYRPWYADGLKRLSEGAVFPSGYQSHAATETCPGHATILTGVHPGRAGIVANNWVDQTVERSDKTVYCAEDPGVPGSSSTHYTVSPHYLKVPTLGDRMKALDPRSRVVAVAGKDRAAVMMGGHNVDESWFWSGKAYTTLVSQHGPMPVTVVNTNKAVAAAMAHPESTPLPPNCLAHSRAIHVGQRSLGTVNAPTPDDWAHFRVSLESDKATTDLAVGLIEEMNLGHGEAPDLLTIGLSATDYVGHSYGTQGPEMCAQIMSVDRNVGRILAALDRLKVSYWVVLTADHGGHDMPERHNLHAINDAKRLDATLKTSDISDALAQQFKLPRPVLLSEDSAGDIYLNKNVPAKLRTAVINAARQRYLAYADVAAVFTNAQLRRVPAPTTTVDEWTLAERFRASFDPARSGDLLVALKPRVSPALGDGAYIASHGSPWQYDRRVPILFYHPGMIGFEEPLPIETVDILPTLAGILGLPVATTEIDGQCRNLGLDDNTCAGRH